jgi:Trk K+ transport system NAD-binding subunit
VSTIRRTDANLALLHGLTRHGHIGRVAVAAHRRSDVERLQEAGADRVLLPYASAAREVVELVMSPT